MNYHREKRPRESPQNSRTPRTPHQNHLKHSHSPRSTPSASSRERDPSSTPLSGKYEYERESVVHGSYSSSKKPRREPDHTFSSSKPPLPSSGLRTPALERVEHHNMRTPGKHEPSPPFTPSVSSPRGSKSNMSSKMTSKLKVYLKMMDYTCYSSLMALGLSTIGPPEGYGTIESALAEIETARKENSDMMSAQPLQKENDSIAVIPPIQRTRKSRFSDKPPIS